MNLPSPLPSPLPAFLPPPEPSSLPCDFSRPLVVAMSGGVDSSVAAGLLCRWGYRVIGITLQLYDERKRSGGASGSRAKSCCAGRDITAAKSAARALGIAHYVLDFESRFQSSVIDDFLSSYRRGETPLPCVRCNQRIKFSSLLDVARDLGASGLATGHYIRKVVPENSEEQHLYRARDGAKDQSYFLFATTREQLDFLHFPLGELHKDETRSLARAMGLPNASKAESQDICFVASRYTQLFPELTSPDPMHSSVAGEICTEDGRVLGRHSGIAGYTVGQRRGLGLGGLHEPLYVVRLDVERNRVYVGERAALAVRGVILRELNLLAPIAEIRQFGKQGGKQGEIMVKYRSLMASVRARVSFAEGFTDDFTDASNCEVIFAEEQLGVSSGQACVFYAGERVLGGGIIDKTLRTESTVATTVASSSENFNLAETMLVAAE